MPQKPGVTSGSSIPDLIAKINGAADPHPFPDNIQNNAGPKLPSNGGEQPILDSDVIYDGEAAPQPRFKAAVFIDSALLNASPAKEPGLKIEYLPSIDEAKGPETSLSTSHQKGAAILFVEAADGHTASVTLTREHIAAAQRLGLRPEALPLFVDPADTKTSAETLSERLVDTFRPNDPGAFEIFLKSDPAANRLKVNALAFSDTPKANLVKSVPAVGAGVVGVLVGGQIADLFIDPVQHPAGYTAAAFYGMEGAMMLYEPIDGVVNNRLMGIGEAVLSRGTMAGVDYAAYESASIGEIYATNMARSVGAKTTTEMLWKGPWSWLKRPFQNLEGFGHVLGLMKIYELTVGQVLPEDSFVYKAGHIVVPFGAMAVARNVPPSVVAEAVAPKLAARFAASRVAMGGLGVTRFAAGGACRALLYAFASDMLFLTAYELIEGDASAYVRSVDTRIYDRGMEESWNQGSYLTWGFMKAAKFIAPTSAIRYSSMYFRPDTGIDHDLEVYAQDLSDSIDIQKGNEDKGMQPLSVRIALLLAAGVGDEWKEPEFYKEINLDAFKDDIELSSFAEELNEELTELRSSEEFIAKKDDIPGRVAMIEEVYKRHPADDVRKAMSEIEARKLQIDIKTLGFIYIDENKKYHDIVDSDGFIRDGKEDAFISLMADKKAGPGTDAAALRKLILDGRKIALIAKILKAPKEEREELMKIASEAGLADENGNIIENELYIEALQIYIAS